MLDKTKTLASTVVNGINVDDLFALIENVRRDAAKGKTNWRVTTTLARPNAEPCDNREFRNWRRAGAAPLLDRHRRAE